MILKHDSYYKYDELTQVLKDFEKKFPKLVKLSSLGKSLEGREIWMATVTDFESGADTEKPALWLDGNTHASELSGCQACVHFIDTMTSGFGKDTEISQLLKTRAFYVIPRISVDGAEYVLQNKTWIRSSPLEFDSDQLKENFKVKDMDGNGEVLQMRFQDPSGAFKISKADPRLMIPREPWDFLETEGPFYHLMDEGEFENFDGFHRKNVEPKRYDLNRQSPAQFSPKEKGAGPLPMTLIEAQYLAKAFVDRPNIVTAITYHTFGGFLLRPSSLRADSDLPILDLEIYKAMGRIGEQVTGYKALSVYHDFRYHPKEVTTGAWDDWHYDHRGVFSWTPEIWSLVSQAGVKLEKALDVYQNPGAENLVKVIRWCDQNLDSGSYYQDWKGFQHPQLGAVEIGGWKTLFTWSNPPAKYLAREISKMTQFAVKLAAMAPQVSVKSFSKEEIGKDIFKIKVVVQNRGFLSTSISETAKSLKVHKTPMVKLNLAPGQKLISGKEEQFIKHLEGRAEALPWISSVWGSDGENRNEDQFIWIVHGFGKMEMIADYQTGGRIKHEISI